MRYLGDMDNTIQPILCCVGAEVAGEPTQFLMERAFNTAHLDWRVITVEVTSDDLQRAWEGMSVMRFRAVRFFRAHQAAAMQLVAEPSNAHLFVGGITSAQRVGDTWTMWHNSGAALIDLLTVEKNWSQSVCWLHGDSMRTRSLLTASLERPPRQIVWTGVPFEVKPELLAQLPLELIPADRESELSELLCERLSGVEPAAMLVHAGEVETRHFDQLQNCQPSSPCDLVVVSSSPGSRRKLIDQWHAGSVKVLTLADLVVAEEAYDQARWTGQPANIEILREAYEEYADF